MSLPPELRVLCYQLSSTPAIELPRIVPSLLRCVVCCQVPLSGSTGNASRADASTTSVLVHKLKTQLSALLNGKISEGRFAAVALIKGVVDVGGWEILQSSGSWVRGLLAILGKPDPTVTKELCIFTLTKIYIMTHQYQTLVREITTPTLPAYVTSCLNLASPKSPGQARDIPSSIQETVLSSFAMLAPRHTSIFRPFASQIRLLLRPFLAPALSEVPFVPSSLQRSAHRLSIILYQTAPRNTGGEEWSKALQELITSIHMTADQVFRAVIEDWESTAGYVGGLVDVNKEPQGGSKNSGEILPWAGIEAGVDRILGMTKLLTEFFLTETAVPVTVPLGKIMDLITRMLSIPVASAPAIASANGTVRLNPAIGGEERDVLWSRLPDIYIAALQLVESIADRLQVSFVPWAQASFDQLTWVFPYGKHIVGFRLASFRVTSRILLQIGNGMDRAQVRQASTMIKSCCAELHYDEGSLAATEDQRQKASHSGACNKHNVDTFLSHHTNVPVLSSVKEADVVLAASQLLPLFMSHISQQYLDISLRLLVERTAIVSKNKAAMLASVLNPFITKNGSSMTSILPHLTHAFTSDDTVEILLRPRMPLLPTTRASLQYDDGIQEEARDEDMEYSHENVEFLDGIARQAAATPEVGTSPQPGIGLLQDEKVSDPSSHQSGFGTEFQSLPAAPVCITVRSSTFPVGERHTAPDRVQPDIDMTVDEDTSDDESVHLTMQLDTESELDTE